MTTKHRTLAEIIFIAASNLIEIDPKLPTLEHQAETLRIHARFEARCVREFKLDLWISEQPAVLDGWWTMILDITRYDVAFLAAERTASK